MVLPFPSIPVLRLSWLPLISAQWVSDVQTHSEQRSQHFFSLKKLAVDHASTLVSFAV